MAAPRRHKRACDAKQIGYRRRAALVNVARIERSQSHGPSQSHLRAAWMNASTSSEDLCGPGRLSTPLATSTIQGSHPGSPCRDVFGSQAAGQDQSGQGGDRVENVVRDERTGAARLSRHVGVDQDRIGRPPQLGGSTEVVGHAAPVRGPIQPKRPNDLKRPELEQVFRRLLSVQLDDPDPQSIRKSRQPRSPAGRRKRRRPDADAGSAATIAAASSGAT